MPEKGWILQEGEKEHTKAPSLALPFNVLACSWSIQYAAISNDPAPGTRAPKLNT